MAARLVAVDASSWIGLAKAKAVDLLPSLFGAVVVTRTVRNEVMAGMHLAGAAELEAAIRTGWMSIADVAPDPVALPELDAGESSTLALAAAQDGTCLVVMDERQGRLRAESLGIPVVGVAGILVAAKARGLACAVRPLLHRLHRAGFRMSSALLRRVLERWANWSECHCVGLRQDWRRTHLDATSAA